MRYILRYNIFEGINNDKKELFEGKTGIPFDEIEGWIYYIGGENLEIKNIFGFPMGKFDGIDYHDSFEINIKSIKNDCEDFSIDPWRDFIKESFLRYDLNVDYFYYTKYYSTRGSEIRICFSRINPTTTKGDSWEIVF